MTGRKHNCDVIDTHSPLPLQENKKERKKKKIETSCKTENLKQINSKRKKKAYIKPLRKQSECSSSYSKVNS